MPALIARRKHHDRRVEIAPAQIGTNVHRTDTVFGMVNKNKVEVIGKTRIRNNFKLGSGSDRIAAASECFHHWSHGVNVVPDQEQMVIHSAFTTAIDGSGLEMAVTFFNGDALKAVV